MQFAAGLLIGLILSQHGFPFFEKDCDRQLLHRVSLQASFFRSIGNFEKEADTLLDAISIAGQINMFHYQRQYLVRLAFSKWNLGKIRESIEDFSEAKLAFKKTGDKRSEEFCSRCIRVIQLYDQGKEDRRANVLFRSLNRIEQAISLGRELGFQYFEIKCRRLQGLLYLDINRPDLFVLSMNRGLDISNATNHVIEKGRYLNNLGVFYQKQNEFSLAADFFERALSALDLVEDPLTKAECLGNLGILYRELGNPSRALYFLSKALEIDKMLGNLASISTDLDNIGAIFLYRGIDTRNGHDVLHALDVFLQCLSLPDENKSYLHIKIAALNNIGIIYNKFGSYKKARFFFNLALKAIERKDIVEKCKILSNIAASFLYEKNIENAIKHYQSSYKLGLENSLENAIMESCLGLGECYENNGDYSSAIAFYEQSIKEMEKVRSRISSELNMMTFLRSKYGIFQRLVKLLVYQYKKRPSGDALEKIFQTIERSKAQSFLESIIRNQQAIADIEKNAVKMKQAELSTDIIQIFSRLTNQEISSDEEQALKYKLEQAEEKYLKNISDMKKYAQNIKHREKKRLCSLYEIQNSILDKRTVLLEYFIGDLESYVVVVSYTAARFYRLAGREEIENSLRGYLKMLKDGSNNRRAGLKAAERIGRELVPYECVDTILDAQSLIIIPDGILHRLPFETIRIDDHKSIKYLVEKIAISYCPSAASLHALKDITRPRAWKKDLLAIGRRFYEQEAEQKDINKIYGNSVLKKWYIEQGFSFNQLSFSEKEIKGIVKLFSKGKIDVLVGKDADEATIKKIALTDYNIIHFACHGFIDEAHPLRSALVLSITENQENDGFLQVREIYALTLNAELVVLSACQTASGFHDEAEGPIGLARPFFSAGARSVIATLWPINDKATVLFMRKFYRYLIKGNTAVNALRLVKIKMLRSSWSHPFYWAGFVIQGNTFIERKIGK